MTSPLPFFLALGSLFALLAFLTIWSRRGTYARPLAVVLLPVGLAALVAAYVQALGYHRPLSMAWGMNKQDVTVLSVKLVQDKAIYLYVDDPAREEPRPLVLPWSNSVAEKISQLQGQSLEGGGGGEMQFRFDPSLNVNEDMFWPMPQQKAMPDKEVPPPPQFYGQES